MNATETSKRTLRMLQKLVNPVSIRMGWTLCLCSLLAGCIWPGNWPHNDRTATYKKAGDRYVVEVYGTALSHSDEVVDVIFPKTNRRNLQFDLPRIEGKIDGSEIRRQRGKSPFVGSITIQGKRMVIDLSINEVILQRLEPIDWNGTYMLVEKKESAPDDKPANKK